MIELKITDPHLMDKAALRRTAVYLLELIGDEIAPAPESNIPAPLAVTPDPIPPALFVPPAPVRVPAVPSMPAQAPIVNGVELDSNGLPWDGRIHARTKSKLASGEWKLKREVDQSVVAAIQAELRQALAAPIIPPTTNIPVAPPSPPTIPPSAVVAAPPTVFEDPVAAPTNDFPALMELVSKLKAENKITSADINAIITSLGLPSLPLAATRPDLIPAIILAIKNKAGV